MILQISRWFAAGSWRCGPGRQPAEECAGGGRELGAGSDQDPDQGGGVQLCQELFTLTEHAAAHLFTPFSDSTPHTLTGARIGWSQIIGFPGILQVTPTPHPSNPNRTQTGIIPCGGLYCC